MPVTIGVFVMHGRVKAPYDKALDRFNRSYEYDGLGDSYARFLLDELLPEVEKQDHSDGRAIQLSHSGNDRASAAQAAARSARSPPPGNGPTLSPACSARSAPTSASAAATTIRRSIRKYEPKPIRVFLQDGSRRSQHLWRRLVDGEPGNGTRPRLRRLRSQSRLGRRRPQRPARHRRSFPRPCAGSGRTGPSR